MLILITKLINNSFCALAGSHLQKQPAQIGLALCLLPILLFGSHTPFCCSSCGDLCASFLLQTRPHCAELHSLYPVAGTCTAIVCLCPPRHTKSVKDNRWATPWLGRNHSRLDLMNFFLNPSSTPQLPAPSACDPRQPPPRANTIPTPWSGSFCFCVPQSIPCFFANIRCIYKPTNKQIEYTHTIPGKLQVRYIFFTQCRLQSGVLPIR